MSFQRPQASTSRTSAGRSPCWHQLSWKRRKFWWTFEFYKRYLYQYFGIHAVMTKKFWLNDRVVWQSMNLRLVGSFKHIQEKQPLRFKVVVNPFWRAYLVKWWGKNYQSHRTAVGLTPNGLVWFHFISQHLKWMVEWWRWWNEGDRRPGQVSLDFLCRFRSTVSQISCLSCCRCCRSFFRLNLEVRKVMPYF